MDKKDELLLKRINTIEKELSKVRGASALTEGWQSSNLAKKQRKWDELAKEKIKLKYELECNLGYEFICDGKCPCCNGNQNCKYPFIK